MEFRAWVARQRETDPHCDVANITQFYVEFWEGPKGSVRIDSNELR